MNEPQEKIKERGRGEQKIWIGGKGWRERVNRGERRGKKEKEKEKKERTKTNDGGFRNMKEEYSRIMMMMSKRRRERKWEVNVRQRKLTIP